MSDKPEKRKVRRLKWAAVIFLLLLTALLVAPFLLTTHLVRLALGQVFPASRLSLGRAVLNPSGTLILHGLVLRDTGALAQQPLIAAREVVAAFAWAELFSLQIRRIHARDVTVYARPNGPSQLSLLDLFSALSRSDPAAGSVRGTLPLWIDTLSVQGTLHVEPVSGFAPASAEWPLALQMTMSGDRMTPSRQFRVAIGETRRLLKEIPKEPSVAATEPAPNADAVFGLLTEVETQPAAAGTRIVLHRLAARRASLTLEADTLRRYATNLPADLQGPFEADLGALDVSGLIGSGMGDAMGFSGHIRLQDLSVRSPSGGKPPLALDGLAAAGSVESQFHPWAPAALKLRDGVLRWATLSYNNNALNNLDASWRLDGHSLMIDRLAGEVFDGHISGSLAWDLRTQSMPRCEFEMKNIDMHAALANLAPEHLDMEGNASGFLHLVLSAEGELSGALDLVFDGPGILRIGEIEEVKRMLVGNVGLALAALALQDLKRYPFKEGRVYLESMGDNAELKIKFVRQPRSEADATPPHKEIVDGQEVWVGSLVVPTIDMTIPITGKSLAEILSIVSGVRALHEPVSEQHGK